LIPDKSFFQTVFKSINHACRRGGSLSHGFIAHPLVKAIPLQYVPSKEPMA